VEKELTVFEKLMLKFAPEVIDRVLARLFADSKRGKDFTEGDLLAFAYKFCD
jgi:hypothetical protein